jgi:hypothetical protein
MLFYHCNHWQAIHLCPEPMRSFVSWSSSDALEVVRNKMQTLQKTKFYGLPKYLVSSVNNGYAHGENLVWILAHSCGGQYFSLA